MAYVSIYRKYRPLDFDSVVGQEHIVRILRNQIKGDSIGHAYLFNGTRGTGKTSIAKIFARAVNCVDNNNGSACGCCDVCKNISNGSLDIIEIDAASNNGVDEIRELREMAKYPPTIGRYKVYIIDEVHMLSKGAFNALLKTLEEPPKHVLFILATTEVHKLPPTILSRCLRFDFRLIPTSQLCERIEYIFKDMDVEYTKDACMAIADAGDGSMRDALSIADICVSYGEGKVDYDVVLEVLGASNPLSVLEIVESIMNSDSISALITVNNLAGYGKSMNILAKDITKMFRNLYIAKLTQDSNNILALPHNIISKLNDIKGDCPKILRCIDLFSAVEPSMRYSTLPRVLLETAIAKACDDTSGVDNTALFMRIKAIEEKLANGTLSAISPLSSTESEVVKKKREFNKASVCGFLIKAVRDKKLFALYSEITELDKNNFSLDGNTLIIKALNDNMANAISNPQYMDIIKALVVNEFEGINNVSVIVQEQAINVAHDIELVKSMFDKNIIKN